MGWLVVISSKDEYFEEKADKFSNPYKVLQIFIDKSWKESRHVPIWSVTQDFLVCCKIVRDDLLDRGILKEE